MDEIKSWWEVPGIAHFCSLFKTAFDLSDFDIEDLEESLLAGASDNSFLLVDLISKLLNGCYGRDDIGPENYDLYLRDIFKQRLVIEQDLPNPLEEKTYFQLSLREKVDLLHQLCNFRLDADDVPELLKGLDGDSMRVEPLGVDAKGAKYWYFYGTRLYMEEPAPVVKDKASKIKKKGKKVAKKAASKGKGKKTEGHAKKTPNVPATSTKGTPRSARLRAKKEKRDKVEEEEDQGEEEEEEDEDEKSEEEECTDDEVARKKDEGEEEEEEADTLAKKQSARLRVNLERKDGKGMELDEDEDVAMDDEVESLKFDDSDDDDDSDNFKDNSSDEDYSEKGSKKQRYSNRRKKSLTKKTKLISTKSVPKTPATPLPQILRHPPRSARLRAKFGMNDEESRDSLASNNDDDRHSTSSHSTIRSEVSRKARGSSLKKCIVASDDASNPESNASPGGRGWGKNTSNPKKADITDDTTQDSLERNGPAEAPGVEKVEEMKERDDGSCEKMEVDSTADQESEIKESGQEGDTVSKEQNQPPQEHIQEEAVEKEDRKNTSDISEVMEEITKNVPESEDNSKDSMAVVKESSNVNETEEEPIEKDEITVKNCDTSEEGKLETDGEENLPGDETNNAVDEKGDNTKVQVKENEDAVETGEKEKTSQVVAEIAGELVNAELSPTTLPEPQETGSEVEDSGPKENGAEGIVGCAKLHLAKEEADTEDNGSSHVEEAEDDEEACKEEASMETNAEKKQKCSPWPTKRAEEMTEEDTGESSAKKLEDHSKPSADKSEIDNILSNDKSEKDISSTKPEEDGDHSVVENEEEMGKETKVEIKKEKEEPLDDIENKPEANDKKSDDVKKKEEGINEQQPEAEKPVKRRVGRPRKIEREVDTDSQDSKLSQSSKVSSISSKEEKLLKPWEPWIPTEASEKTGWHLVCEVVEDWEHLASMLDGNVRCEKSLLRTVRNDFLPEIPAIQEEKEKERKRRELENAPRRLSTRLLYKKKEQDDMERILREAQEEEERQKAQEEEERRKRLEEEKLEEQRRQREERERAREERAKRVLLREERARLIAEGKEIPPELMNGIKSDGHTVEEQYLEDDVVSKLHKVLMACMKHNESWPFVEAVEEKFAPGYFDIIKVPMTLSEMENKLNNGKYASKEEFISDMDLIVENCEEYNGEDSDFSIMARNLRNAFSRSIRRMFPVVRTKKDDEDFVLDNDRDFGSVTKKYRAKREASKRARDSFPELLSDDSQDTITRNEVIYRPTGCLRNYSRNYKGYESKLTTSSSSSATSNELMDSMLKSGRQVITSTPPAKYNYKPGDQVFDVCLGRQQPKAWKDMPPVLQPEVSTTQGETSTAGGGTPVPTWSYRRETGAVPSLTEEGPPKLRRMVPSPVTTMLREHEQQQQGKEPGKSVFIPINRQAQGPPVLQAQRPMIVSSGGVTKVSSAMHTSGGTVRPAGGVTSAQVGLTPKPAPRVMHISKEDYLRLLAQNKIKVVQQAPGGKGQVIQLQPGLQIITQRPQASPAAATGVPAPVGVVSAQPQTVPWTVPITSISSSILPTTAVAKKPLVMNPWSVTETVPSPSVVSETNKEDSQNMPASLSAAQAIPGASGSLNPSVSLSGTRSVSALQGLTGAVEAAPVLMSSVASAPTTDSLPSSTIPVPSTDPRTVKKGVGNGDSNTITATSSESAKNTLKNCSHKQFSDCTSNSEQSTSAGNIESDGSTSDGSEASLGMNGSNNDINNQGQGRVDKKRKAGDVVDGDTPGAKISRPSQEAVLGNSKAMSSQKPVTKPNNSDQKTAMPKLNLSGLTSHLAGAMAKKLEKCSSELNKTSPPSKHNHADTGGKCSEQQQPPFPDQENLDKHGELSEDSDVEEEASSAPPLLEPVSDSSSSNHKKGNLFESMDSSYSSSEIHNSKSSEATPPKLKVPSSGSRCNKSPLKHADSNIFQRMLDFSSGESPDKSSTEDQAQ